MYLYTLFRSSVEIISYINKSGLHIQNNNSLCTFVCKVRLDLSTVTHIKVKAILCRIGSVGVVFDRALENKIYAS